jgi:hypothetical protein
MDDLDIMRRDVCDSDHDNGISCWTECKGNSVLIQCTIRQYRNMNSLIEKKPNAAY